MRAKPIIPLFSALIRQGPMYESEGLSEFQHLHRGIFIGSHFYLLTGSYICTIRPLG